MWHEKMGLTTVRGSTDPCTKFHQQLHEAGRKSVIQSASEVMIPGKSKEPKAQNLKRTIRSFVNRNKPSMLAMLQIFWL
jgi:lysophospholipid acyltransferase (LPLAT)-like uncharacterized protein